MQSPPHDEINLTFQQFCRNVRDSVETHAQRKGYRTSDVDGPNEIADFMHSQGLGRIHGISEAIYKLLEYHKTPRRVLLEKVCGWCWILWERTKD